MAIRESPTSSWLEIVPARNPLSNPTFDEDIAGWEMGEEIAPDVPAHWELLDEHGQTGAGADDFNTPAQVAIDEANDRLWIADTANGDIKLRTLSTGGSASIFNSSATTIKGIAVAPDGGLWVNYFNSAQNRIEFGRFDSSLVFDFFLPQAVATGHAHIAVDATHAYFVLGNTIYKHLHSGGSLVASWGTTGSGNTNYSNPYGIGVSGGEVYVVDAGNSRVKVTGLTGTYVREWPVSANARGLAFDAAGNVLVAEFGSDVVKRYTNVGILIDEFSQANADGIAVDGDGIAWVTNATGDTLAEWQHNEISPGSITVVRSWDGTIGGAANGSHKTEITVNAAGAGASAETLSSAWLPLNGRPSVNVAAWVRSDSANLTPRLRIVFADAAGVTVATETEAVWTPVAGEEYTRVFAARAPVNASQYKVGWLTYATIAEAVGSTWTDDVLVNANVLVVEDAGGDHSGLKVQVQVPGRWL